MYWTTLSLFLAAESFLSPIISWLPFYSWIRFGAHLYLVLPGQQGSVYIYQTYIHPFLYEHEREIDQFISSSHDNAKKAGLQYLKQAIEWAKVNMLGLPPRRPTPPSSRQVSYSTSLLQRFSMPTARDGTAQAGTGDLFSVLGNVMQQAGYGSTKSRDLQHEDLSASGLIPPSMAGQDRTNYISEQRDRLRTLLQAFDQEASRSGEHEALPSDSPPRSAGGYKQPVNLQKSKSELDFEDLGNEDLPPTRVTPNRSTSWASKWIWGDYGEKDSAAVSKKEE